MSESDQDSNSLIFGYYEHSSSYKPYDPDEYEYENQLDRHVQNNIEERLDRSINYSQEKMGSQQSKQQHYYNPLTGRYVKTKWKPEEKKKYHYFLSINFERFMKMNKLFGKMEKFIGTKSAEECRSYHRQMEKKHKSIEVIKDALEQQFYGSKEGCLSESKGMEFKEEIIRKDEIGNEATPQKSTINSQHSTSIQTGSKETYALDEDYEDDLQEYNNRDL